MPNYEIIHPVFLNGKIHKSGWIEADAKDAQPLVDTGSLVLDDDQIDFGLNDPDGESKGNTATLVGGITKDGRVVELSEWKVPELKKLATDLNVKSVANLNKQALIDAITAIEMSADNQEQ